MDLKGAEHERGSTYQIMTDQNINNQKSIILVKTSQKTG